MWETGRIAGPKILFESNRNFITASNDYDDDDDDGGDDSTTRCTILMQLRLWRQFNNFIASIRSKCERSVFVSKHLADSNREMSTTKHAMTEKDLQLETETGFDMVQLASVHSYTQWAHNLVHGNNFRARPVSSVTVNNLQLQLKMIEWNICRACVRACIAFHIYGARNRF